MTKTTMLFNFDITTQMDNPHQTETPWGKPAIIAVGNIFEENDRFEEVVSNQTLEIQRLRALTQWQPIETAPKDGTVVLLWGDAPWRVRVASYGKSHPMEIDEWLTVPRKAHQLDTCEPTHWMPLPAGPDAPGNKDKCDE